MMNIEKWKIQTKNRLLSKADFCLELLGGFVPLAETPRSTITNCRLCPPSIPLPWLSKAKRFAHAKRLPPSNPPILTTKKICPSQRDRHIFGATRRIWTYNRVAKALYFKCFQRFVTNFAPNRFRLETL